MFVDHHVFRYRDRSEYARWTDKRWDQYLRGSESTQRKRYEVHYVYSAYDPRMRIQKFGCSTTPERRVEYINMDKCNDGRRHVPCLFRPGTCTCEADDMVLIDKIAFPTWHYARQFEKYLTNQNALRLRRRRGLEWFNCRMPIRIVPIFTQKRPPLEAAF